MPGVAELAAVSRVIAAASVTVVMRVQPASR